MPRKSISVSHAPTIMNTDPRSPERLLELVIAVLPPRTLVPRFYEFVDRDVRICPPHPGRACPLVFTTRGLSMPSGFTPHSPNHRRISAAPTLKTYDTLLRGP